MLVLVSGCASRQTVGAAPAASAPPAAAAPAPAEPAVSIEQLPPGPGRQILASACTSCHNLREVTKFAGFYGRAQWRDIVLTMVDYGAPVSEKNVEVLADYLTEHLGKQ